ncbi:hypothetical protein ACLOJK_007995 [Asimina triloba]
MDLIGSAGPERRHFQEPVPLKRNSSSKTYFPFLPDSTFASFSAQAEKSQQNRAAAALASRFRLWRSLSLPEMDGGGDFNRLDEGCVAHILSFTSPRDVCRLSAVSRKFQAAAESEVPWQKFLPSDWWHLILRSVSALHFTSKKDLFFRLSKSILIDDSRRGPHE